VLCQLSYGGDPAIVRGRRRAGGAKLGDDEPVALATFKDLVMDAQDALMRARFWQRTLGGTLVDRGDGSYRIDPPPGRGEHETIWVDSVPEPHTVKTRVHLDVELPEPDPEPLLRNGARVLREPGEDHWWLMADPDGNEFCAFPPEGTGAGNRVIQLVLDCRDSQATAQWWASVLGGTLRQAEYGPKLTGAAGFPWRDWLFQSVPEPKTAKNRVHWDVLLADPVPDALLERGATVLREPDGDVRWWVLADPEGNEFCGVPAKTG
jgi:catechol 2,3-dioxygenase-like lactoylglutathione lyase family enzyme